jgi:ABC-type transport system involved in cytochrome bd biosynthesis fused ATPase/permease subunit
MKFKFTTFDRLILLTPLLIPFVVCVGVVVGLISPTGLLDIQFALILSIILGVYILVMLWHVSTFEPLETQSVTGGSRNLRKILLLIVMSCVGVAFTYFLLWVRR